MPTFGRVEEYDSKEPWSSYTERLDAFFNANGIEEDENKWIFLSTVGTSTYATLRRLLAPDKPKEKNFRELISTLNSHFSPAPSEIAESFRFHSRVQLENESVAEFVAELRQIAEHCNFGTALNRMLRDRLVWSRAKAVVDREKPHSEQSRRDCKNGRGSRTLRKRAAQGPLGHARFSSSRRLGKPSQIQEKARTGTQGPEGARIESERQNQGRTSREVKAVYTLWIPRSQASRMQAYQHQVLQVRQSRSFGELLFVQC
ncbi:hypothetical protein MTO96_044414 [Rhipicephalus appendiculatus]